MIILLNIVLLLLVIASLASAYILIYVFAGEHEKFNVELRDTYIVMTDEYDRGFKDKNEALDFAALHSGIIISAKTGDTVADFTTIDYNIIHDPHVRLTVNEKGVITNVKNN